MVNQDLKENSNDEVDAREEDSDDEEDTQVKVLMALSEDDLHCWKESYYELRQAQSETEPTTPSVPIEVKNTEQESKINELTKLVHRILYCMICKREDHRTSDHEMYIASLKRSENYKAQPYQPSDCRNYPECGICGSYDHFTSRHNCVIHIRGGMLAESS
ncbi:hypothetical protein Tco_0513597 [Tanacetum coccineum]